MNSYSQNKGFVGLSFGGSTPINEFGSSNPTSLSSGLAKTGVAIDFLGQYQFKKNYGFAATFRNQYNPLDDNKLLSNAKQILKFEPEQKSIQTTNWIVNSVLVGGYYTFFSNQKINLDVRAQLGGSYIIAPKIAVQYSDKGTNGAFEFRNSNATTFSYSIGTGVRYPFLKKYCLLLNVDYFNSKAKLPFNAYIAGTDIIVYSESVSETIEIVNYTFGIGYQF